MPDVALLDALFRQLLALQWLEIAGLSSGLLCVWLLIRQNVWNWPIGLFYALVSVAVFFRARLYADFALHVFYCAMNAYGWYYWLRGGRSDAADDLPVTSVPRANALSLGLLAGLGTLAAGYLLSTQTDAALPFWDSSIAAMSLAAMWMQARKYIESWYVWLMVDVVATFVYLSKGLELYAVLYGVYIAMAFAGWWAWRRALA